MQAKDIKFLRLGSVIQILGEAVQITKYNAFYYGVLPDKLHFDKIIGVYYVNQIFPVLDNMISWESVTPELLSILGLSDGSICEGRALTPIWDNENNRVKELQLTEYGRLVRTIDGKDCQYLHQLQYFYFEFFNAELLVNVQLINERL